MNPVKGCWDTQAILLYLLDLSAQTYHYQEIQYASNGNKKYLQMLYKNGKGKSKVIPLQARCGPECG